MNKIKVHRGDKTPVEILLTGDYTNKTIAFGATADKESTTNRLIYIEDNELSKVYNSATDKTKVSFILEKEDTEALQHNRLFGEIVDLDNDDTPYECYILINKDAIGPFNNLPLETENLRHLILDTKDYEDFTLLLFTKASGPIPITIDELSGIVDRESFTEPEIDLCNLDGVTSTNGLRDQFKKIEKRFEKNENEVVLLAEKQTVVTNYIVEQDIFQEELDINNIIGV